MLYMRTVSGHVFTNTPIRLDARVDMKDARVNIKDTEIITKDAHGIT